MNKTLLCKYLREHKFLDYVIVFVVGLVSLSWFRGNHLILGHGDGVFGLRPLHNLYSNLFIWVDNISTGSPWHTLSLGFLPLRIYSAFMELIGASLITNEKILFYLLFTLSGVFAYCLGSILLNKKRVACLIFALFYMMNPFSLSTVWTNRYTSLMFSYALLPVVLALYIRGINSGKIRYAILISILQGIFAAALPSPPAMIVIGIIAFSYLLFFAAQYYKEKRRIIVAIKFNLILVILLFIINAWWVLPNVYFLRESYNVATKAYSSLEQFSGASSYSAVLNTFRLLGWYFVYQRFYGDSLYAWSKVYLYPLFVPLTFLIPVVAYLSLLIFRKNKYVIYFIFLSLLATFLMKGPSSPFNQINFWIIKNVPFGYVFRGAYEKFAPVLILSYSFLIATTVNWLYENGRKRSKYWYIPFFTIFILLFGVVNFPFWTGDIIYPGGRVLPSARVNIPKYYYDAGQYVNKQIKDFRIVSIPPRLGGITAYSWRHGYLGSDPIDQHFFYKPIIGIGPISTMEKMLFFNFGQTNVDKLLGMMNVKYVLIHRDWHPRMLESYTPLPETAIKIFNEVHKDIHLEKSFDKLDFYKVDGKHFLPHIYASP